MKLFLILLLSVFSLSAVAMPSTGLRCHTQNDALDVQFEVSRYTGDLYGLVSFTESGKKKPARIQQFINYNNHLFAVLSLGEDSQNDDRGFILEASSNKDPKKAAVLTGGLVKYTTNFAPGYRDIVKGSDVPLICETYVN